MLCTGTVAFDTRFPCLLASLFQTSTTRTSSSPPPPPPAGTIVATVFIGLGVIVVATVQFAFLPAQWYIAGRMAAAAGAGARAS